MRLFLLTAVVMVAFAANSLLNRAGLLQPGMDAISFGTLRLVAGAGVLGVLFWLRQRRRPQGTRPVIGVRGVLPLLLYIYGFSAAYGALNAGLGALVLFGRVQLTIFIAAISQGEVLSMRRLLGAAVAFGGLVLLLAPMGAGAAISLPHAAAMAAAGIGWVCIRCWGAARPIRWPRRPPILRALRFWGWAPVWGWRCGRACPCHRRLVWHWRCCRAL